MSSHLSPEMSRRSRSFEAWALEYDRYRPSYPDGLFDQIATRLSLPTVPVVADLGAGTGKAALAMARRGSQVIAVEPGEGMLDVLRARASTEGLNVDTRLSSAEDTGLPEASVDLVTVAQAFHWFDKARAVREMARIVRPGGGVAIFWNARADDRSPFLAGHMAVLGKYVPEDHIDHRAKDDESSTQTDLSEGGFFDVDPRLILRHEVAMTVDDFVHYAFTASYVRLFVEPDDQDRLRAELLEQAREYAVDGKVTVELDVDVYVGRRNSA